MTQRIYTVQLVDGTNEYSLPKNARPLCVHTAVRHSHAAEFQHSAGSGYQNSTVQLGITVGADQTTQRYGTTLYLVGDDAAPFEQATFIMTFLGEGIVVQDNWEFVESVPDANDNTLGMKAIWCVRTPRPDTDDLVPNVRRRALG